MDGVHRTGALGQELKRRERILKLRWLGLDDEADRLAQFSATPPFGSNGIQLPVEHPETD
jgi:hypothetical protein